jgi:hypothetical protein
MLAPALVAIVVFAPVIVGGIVFRHEDCSQVACALPLSFGAPLYVIALGYVVFFLQWRTLPLTKYLTSMRADPARFLEGQYDESSWPKVIHRTELYEAVAIELRARRARAQFITGPPGSGKTTCLLGLAEWLAARGAVPVLLPLTGVETPINLQALAKARFIRILDASEAQGDRLWRQLCRSRRVVILADGLDEAALGASELDPRQLRGELRVGGWPPVVFTSRPATVPSVDRAPPFRLGELRKHAVASSLADRVSAERGQRMETGDAEALATALAVPTEPFYLGLVVAVLTALEPRSAKQLVGKLTSSEVQQARNLLLKEYFDALADGRILKDVPIDIPRRSAALDEAGEIALHMLMEEAVAARLDALLERPATAGGEVRPLRRAERVEFACRLGIVQLIRSGSERELRFHHRIVRACLAARAMRLQGDSGAVPGTDAWREFLIYNVREESFLAVRLLGLGRPVLANEIVTFLLEQAECAREPSYRLLYATAAANIVRDNDLDRVDAVCGAVWRGWPHATKTSCFAAVRALGALEDERSYELLWTLVRQADYSIAWGLVEVLTGAPGVGAWNALRPAAERALDECERNPTSPDEDTVIPDLSVVAKVLPSFVAKSGSSDARDALARLVRAVGDMSKAGRGLGVEASLGQGFKQAADEWPSTPDGGSAERVAQIGDFLGSARFWYSRVNALQALALLAHKAGDLKIARAAIEERRKDAHPLVRAAAELAREALSVELAERGRYVWHDESVDIERSGVELHPRASQLLADVVLILNMNEQSWALPDDQTSGPFRGAREGEQEALVRQHAAVGTLDVLPACIKVDRDRLLGARPIRCVPGCSFRLCPYSSPRQRKGEQVTLGHAHRGDPSPAFCLHQKSLLLSHRVPAWLRWHPPLFEKPPPRQWPNPLRRRALRNFWGEMQARGESSGFDVSEA